MATNKSFRTRSQTDHPPMFAIPAFARSLFPGLLACSTLAVSPVLQAADIFIWTGEERALALTDAQLEEDKARGVRGFVCGMGQMPFTEVKAKKCEATVKPLAERLHAHGMTLALTISLSHYWNASTPMAPWFDDDDEVAPGKSWIKWTHDYVDPINGEKRLSIITQLRMFAEMCQRNGVDEIVFDQEEQKGGHTEKLGGRTCSWMWNYPADEVGAPNWIIPPNTHTKEQTRAKAEERGKLVMQTLLRACPKLNLAVYYNRLAGTQWEFQFTSYTKKPNPYHEDGVMFAFWDGLTSVEGYHRISHLDSGWYKTKAKWPDWDTGLENRNKATRATYAMMERADYLLPRLAIIPFWWPDKSRALKEANGYAAYKGDEKVLEQAKACARWTEGNRSHVYTHFYRQESQHWDEDSIWAAIRAASAIQGPPIPSAPTIKR
jgi:hypothetical protein